MDAVTKAAEALAREIGDPPWSDRHLAYVVRAVLDAVGHYTLRAERYRYKAALDKVADVFNARDAVTEDDAKLYANQPGEALANAVADIMDERDSYRYALTAIKGLHAEQGARIASVALDRGTP